MLSHVGFIISHVIYISMSLKWDFCYDLMLPKQRKALVDSYSGYFQIFQSSVTVPKHIHHIELGAIECIDIFKQNCVKMLPCVCFIRLGVKQWQV